MREIGSAGQFLRELDEKAISRFVEVPLQYQLFNTVDSQEQSGDSKIASTLKTCSQTCGN